MLDQIHNVRVIEYTDAVKFLRAIDSHLAVEQLDGYSVEIQYGGRSPGGYNALLISRRADKVDR